jgi:hypothetical protein
MSKPKRLLTTATDELLRGLPAIQEATGSVSEQAAQRLLRRGLPTMKLGKEVATTKQAILAWVRAEAERKTV